MATPILVPPLGQTTDTVVFAAWYKQVGESVQVGESLFAIETDKATLDIEAQTSGVLRSVNAAAGDEVAVLSTIGIIAAEGEIPGSVEMSKETPAAYTAIARVENVHKVIAPTYLSRQTGASRFFISPRAKRFAEDNHVEWHELIGTGSLGAVVERDVRAFLASKEQTTASAQVVLADIPSTPLVTGGSCSVISSQVVLSHVMAMLERIKKHDRSYSVDDIIITMVLRALQNSPVADEISNLMTIGLVSFADIESTVQVLQLPGTARIQQVRQARDAVQPIRVTAQQQLDQFSIAYINLDGLRLDSVSSMPNIRRVPLLQLGRMHRNSEGSVSVLLSLNIQQQSTDFNRAVTLLSNVVRLIEDPDLLF